MYDFLTGPVLWIAVAVCVGGLALRLAYLFGVSRARDRNFYNHTDLAWATASIVHWGVPWASAAMRRQPIFTLVGFVFHVCLLTTPLLFGAHNILLDEAFGISLPSISDHVADLLTAIVVACGLFLIGRRIFRAEVRTLSSPWDFALLIAVLLPFVTGFLAHHQLGPYDELMLLHVLSGEILLVLIPFTKLAHGALFFITRAFIGFELGGRRGARSW